MSRQLHTGWFDTVATDTNSHCKEACWPLRTLLKTENILPLLGIQLLYHHLSSHSRFTVLTTELSGFSTHLEGFQLKTKPRRTASLTALHFCMLCISTVPREEFLKVLIICHQVTSVCERWRSSFATPALTCG